MFPRVAVVLTLAEETTHERIRIVDPKIPFHETDLKPEDALLRLASVPIYGEEICKRVSLPSLDAYR